MSKPRLLLASGDSPHEAPVSHLAAILASGFELQFLQLSNQAEDEINIDTLQKALLESGTSEHTIIGGFSLGARIAAMVSMRSKVLGLVGLSFPFHRHGHPQDRHGLATLGQVTVPTLIIQGARDSHGNEQQVRGMALPGQVRLAWLRDANHRWHTRGTTEDGQAKHAKDAAKLINDFAQTLISKPHA